jgi:uncharacterized protein involved in response to NO
MHGWLMRWGQFGPFIFGFLFTVLPRWQSGPEVPKPVCAAVFAAAVSALALGFAGLLGDATLFFAAIVLLAFTWLSAWVVLLWIMLKAEGLVAHAVVAAIALGCAAMAQFCYAIGIYTGDAALLHLMLRTALWGGLLPLVYAVCHRMLPFFAQGVLMGYRVYRPTWRLVAVTALCYLHLALALAGLYAWLWLVTAPLLWITLVGGLRWEPLRSRGTPLLWTLFLAYLWLPLGLALQLASDLSFAISGDWMLGRAPLHALGIGFLASLVVAMATRVTLGHSGRRLVMDRYTLACFVAVQVAAVLRVASELALPPAPALFVPLAALAALAWLAGFLPWAVRYGRMCLEPRIDGRPG